MKKVLLLVALCAVWSVANAASIMVANQSRADALVSKEFKDGTEGQVFATFKDQAGQDLPQVTLKSGENKFQADTKTVFISSTYARPYIMVERSSANSIVIAVRGKDA